MHQEFSLLVVLFVMPMSLIVSQSTSNVESALSSAGSCDDTKSQLILDEIRQLRQQQPDQPATQSSTNCCNCSQVSVAAGTTGERKGR